MDPQKPKILIVEDDPALQSMYVRKLTHENFDPVAATNGQQAIQFARDQKPQLILLDVMLPGDMNGFDVLEVFMRDEELKKIPVIMMTNISAEEETAKKIGAVDYLIKSNTSLDDMVGKIKRYLTA